jgi:hypothetical protein
VAALPSHHPSPTDPSKERPFHFPQIPSRVVMVVLATLIILDGRAVAKSGCVGGFGVCADGVVGWVLVLITLGLRRGVGLVS